MSAVTASSPNNAIAGAGNAIPAALPAAAISAEQLGKCVSSPAGPLDILASVTFSIASGTTAAIVGASGSGKSTLLGLLAGLDIPTSGRVLLDDQDLNVLDEDGRAQLRALKVGFVFQTFQLLPSLNALENAMLPLELAGLANARQRAEEVLGRVGLGARVEHYPRQLSGGEQQRVAIARAFAASPSLLFADEPTGNLDKQTGQQIADLLFALNAEHGTTLVLVTHDPALAARCARTLELSGGRLVAHAANHA
jgi:putative ABC transport system ATP-binding protein